MKPINILYYAVAFFAPILIFTVLTDNTNEQYPALVFLCCIALFAAAGYLSSIGFVKKAVLKWVSLSILVGIVEACLLSFAF